MPFRYSEKIRNDRLTVIASALGPAAIMRIFAGAVPSTCDAADPPGKLVEIELPRQPFLAPSGAKLMISQPWTGYARADGTAKSFRISDYLGAVHVQGTITKNGGGGDLQLDTTEVHTGQKVVVGAMTLVEFGDLDDEEARRALRELEEAEA
jgi:hypothetical protein